MNLAKSIHFFLVLEALLHFLITVHPTHQVDRSPFHHFSYKHRFFPFFIMQPLKTWCRAWLHSQYHPSPCMSALWKVRARARVKSHNCIIHFQAPRVKHILAQVQWLRGGGRGRLQKFVALTWIARSYNWDYQRQKCLFNCDFIQEMGNIETH